MGGGGKYLGAVCDVAAKIENLVKEGFTGASARADASTAAALAKDARFAMLYGCNNTSGAFGEIIVVCERDGLTKIRCGTEKAELLSDATSLGLLDEIEVAVDEELDQDEFRSRADLYTTYGDRAECEEEVKMSKFLENGAGGFKVHVASLKPDVPYLNIITYDMDPDTKEFKMAHITFKDYTTVFGDTDAINIIGRSFEGVLAKAVELGAVVKHVDFTEAHLVLLEKVFNKVSRKDLEPGGRSIPATHKILERVVATHIGAQLVENSNGDRDINSSFDATLDGKRVEIKILSAILINYFGHLCASWQNIKRANHNVLIFGIRIKEIDKLLLFELVNENGLSDCGARTETRGRVLQYNGATLEKLMTNISECPDEDLPKIIADVGDKLPRIFRAKFRAEMDFKRARNAARVKKIRDANPEVRASHNASASLSQRTARLDPERSEHIKGKQRVRRAAERKDPIKGPKIHEAKLQAKKKRRECPVLRAQDNAMGAACKKFKRLEEKTLRLTKRLAEISEKLSKLNHEDATVITDLITEADKIDSILAEDAKWIDGFKAMHLENVAKREAAEAERRAKLEADRAKNEVEKSENLAKRQSSRLAKRMADEAAKAEKIAQRRANQ